MPTRTFVEMETDVAASEPKMYAVVIHNDDYTPMDFVVMILTKIFNKNDQDAETSMMEVHKNGMGVAGVYTFDIALTKKIQADQMAAEKGHPLKVTLAEEMYGGSK